MRMRSIIACFFFLFYAGFLHAQYVEESEKSEKKAPVERKTFGDRTFYGGNFGIMFGTITLIDLSPNIGYRLTEKFSAGVGVTYMYYHDSRFRYSTNIYGGRLFARHVFLEKFFAHAEYEILNLELYDVIDFKMSRVNYPRLLLGAGFLQRMSERTAFSLLILLNVLDDTEYMNRYRFSMPNPDIRIGFIFGI